MVVESPRTVWKGVLGAVPLSPVDLESHFERDGLFDKGLKRFELDVQKRIAERGTFSAVLTRLADMKAPTVFMLDEAVDIDLTREQVLEVLESLSQAPFHLISKVDSGEFCLRYRVSDSALELVRLRPLFTRPAAQPPHRALAGDCARADAGGRGYC